jgi:predicted nuclease of predicted toxin-antitoxin system
MRILLDESLPRRLRGFFAGHDVITVVEAGWSGVKNGELLQLASKSFDLFVTADQNLQYQQNLDALPIAVAVLIARDTRFESLRLPASDLLSQLPDLVPRSLLRCGG